MGADSGARPFQTCGACKYAWSTWEDFVRDPGVRLVGLQAFQANTDYNLLVFEHRCRGSVSILTPRLRHLLPPPSPDDPKVRLLGTHDCRGHCNYLEDQEMCDAACSSARDRKLILLVRQMKQEVKPA